MLLDSPVTQIESFLLDSSCPSFLLTTTYPIWQVPEVAYPIVRYGIAWLAVALR